jgi:hypothetical protein
MDAVTFTRASNANEFNAQGLLVTRANQGALGNNLLTFPQDFDNAAWGKSNTTITANAEVAPDGTLTSEKLQENTANQTHFISQSVTVGSQSNYTVSFSIYLKAAERTWVALQVANNSRVDYYFRYFNLSTGQAGTNTGSNGVTSSSYNIESVGNDWYRITVTATFTSVTSLILSDVFLASADGTATYTGNGISGIYIWGAQLELGSTATEYFPTNINQPRFDWASTAGITSTNLLLYSQDFSNAKWQVSSTTLQNNVTTAPDGSATGGKVISSLATNAQNFFYNDVPVTAGLTYTASIYLKYAGKQFVQLLVSNFFSTNYANFDLVNKTITAGTYVNASVTDVGNDWLRCSFSFVSLSTGSNLDFFPAWFIDSGTAARAPNSTGNGTDAVEVWGAQLEVGTAPTNYIQTAANTVTLTSTPLTANPTSNGLLIEESRTNRLLWNRDATQANWVKTDVTAAKDQTGIDGVANAASSLTATSADGTCIQTITLASGSRTGSVYLKRITGTGTVQVSLDGSTYSTVDLSDTEWRRIRLSGTVTNPTVGIKIATSGDAVAMDYAQVEDGAFATTPILTTTATVTRSADVASVALNTLAPVNYRAVSYYVEFTKDTSTNNTDLFAVGGTSLSATTNVRTVVTSTIIEYVFNNASRGVTTKQNGLNKTVVSLTITSGIGGANGISVRERGANNAAPFPVIQYSSGGQALILGQFGNSSGFLNGTMKKIAIIPTYLSSNAVEELTR